MDTYRAPIQKRNLLVEEIADCIKTNTNTTPRSTDTTFGHVVSYNKKQYRSPEFSRNIDLLTAGCSFTFGTGLPINGLWSTMIAKKNKLSHNSVSMAGGSVMHIVFDIFKYFEEFGHPKILLCLFPDFNRIYTCFDGKVLQSNINKNQTKDRKSTGIADDSGPSLKDSYAKYINLPTSPENVYSKENTYFLNSMYIRMLEIYCNSHNIPFIWFKWTEERFDTAGGLDSFSNLYKINVEDELQRYTPKDPKHVVHTQMCHQEERLASDREVWHTASDVWHTASDNGHFGIHWQIHVKELFEKALKEKGLI